MATIKDRSKNPGYSPYTQQLFMNQLSERTFNILNEKMFRFPGFYVQRRSIRQYEYPYAAHILGDVAEVSPADIEEDDYYQPGDYIGKLGVERQYEKQLRGEKGIQILLKKVWLIKNDNTLEEQTFSLFGWGWNWSKPVQAAPSD